MINSFFMDDLNYVMMQIRNVLVMLSLFVMVMLMLTAVKSRCSVQRAVLGLYLMQVDDGEWRCRCRRMHA